MNIGMIGLGRMGLAIAQRLQQAGHQVIGYDRSGKAEAEATHSGITHVHDLALVAKAARVLWLMVPAGKPVDDVLEQLAPDLHPGDIIIDGGNSNFKDSVRRYHELAAKNISFLDCGTSGGLHGKELGYSLMIGGDQEAFQKLTPIFQAIAAPSGYAYMGPSGSGHYVKMVHNGIEYGLLQAYAEGFQLLKEGNYPDLDLEKIARVWNHGSIVRSWILQLTENIFERDQDFKDISGNIGENLTGQWTVNLAKELNIPIPVIQAALQARAWSRETGGNYATKLVALLRHEFGGHEVKKINS